MAVGERFNDPDTQAAIAAAAGTNTTTPATEAEVKPKEADVEKPSEQVTEQQTTEKPVETPNQSDEDGNKSESASADNDLDISKVKAPTQEEVDAALADAGFSPDALGKELAENGGKLTAETVAALKEKFPAAAVDNSVKELEEQFADKVGEMKEAQAATDANVAEMNNYIFSELGSGDVEKGTKNLEVLSSWAKDNIDKATLEAINVKLASGNKTVVREGLETAVNLWKKGQERPMMSGDSAAQNQQEPAEKVEPLSRDQYIRIQMTDKYQTDLEYAEKVDNRRRASMKTEGFMTPEYNAQHRPAF